MIVIYKKAFTLVELLIVIAIIGLLSTVAVIALGASRVKARDTKRAADMRQVLVAMHIFQDQNGCLPTTADSTCPGIGGYSESNFGTWDYSSQGGFMTFLSTSGVMAKTPVDPINNMTGDAIPAGTFAYRYFCYPNGPHLGYWREQNRAYVAVLWQGTTNDFSCQ